MPSRERYLQTYGPAAERFFDRTGVSVYTEASLSATIAEHRSGWNLGRVPIALIIDFLRRESRMRVLSLESVDYPPVSRYTWGTPSVFELALSLRPNSYLSYGTAAYLGGFLKEAPATLHVNKEQSPKQRLGTLTQEGLDRAFASRPRRSRLVYLGPGGHRFVVVAGKATNNLGVGVLKGPAGERLLATKVERTLVDLAVRPIYCGGVHKVLEAYRAARHVLRVERLMATLRKLDHLYPYHQAIGFYLERAGFDATALDLARQPGLEFDFYLTHGMDEAVYDRTWRLHYPRGM